MDPITIGMDVLLAVLLLAALTVGMRLNGRLKALRESHQGFAKAVAELDAAAQKADRALKALHNASEEAHDALLTRIETARSLTLKLENASHAAEKAARRAEEAAARAPTFEAPISAFRRVHNETASARQFHPAAEMDGPERTGERTSERAGERGGVSSVAASEVAPVVAPTSAPRRHKAAADELFAEAEEAVRPGLARLMQFSLERSR